MLRPPSRQRRHPWPRLPGVVLRSDRPRSRGRPDQIAAPPECHPGIPTAAPGDAGRRHSGLGRAGRRDHGRRGGPVRMRPHRNVWGLRPRHVGTGTGRTRPRHPVAAPTGHRFARQGRQRAGGLPRPVAAGDGFGRGTTGSRPGFHRTSVPGDRPMAARAAERQTRRAPGMHRGPGGTGDRPFRSHVAPAPGRRRPTGRYRDGMVCRPAPPHRRNPAVQAAPAPADPGFGRRRPVAMPDPTVGGAAENRRDRAAQTGWRGDPYRRPVGPRPSDRSRRRRTAQGRRMAGSALRRPEPSPGLGAGRNNRATGTSRTLARRHVLDHRRVGRAGAEVRPMADRPGRPPRDLERPPGDRSRRSAPGEPAAERRRCSLCGLRPRRPGSGRADRSRFGAIEGHHSRRRNPG